MVTDSPIIPQIIHHISVHAIPCYQSFTSHAAAEARKIISRYRKYIIDGAGVAVLRQIETCSVRHYHSYCILTWRSQVNSGPWLSIVNLPEQG